MLNKKHTIAHDDRERVLIAIKGALEERPEISFAYVHGSFLKDEGFGDIDLALYLKDIPGSPLQYELAMETDIMKVAGKYLIDVRLLNAAPLSFRYNVLKEGKSLVVRNDDERAGFIEATLADYFDFAPYRAQYLKETLGLGV